VNILHVVKWVARWSGSRVVCLSCVCFDFQMNDALIDRSRLEAAYNTVNCLYDCEACYTTHCVQSLISTQQNDRVEPTLQSWSFYLEKLTI